MTRVALAVAVSFIASFAAVPVAAAQPVGPRRPPATSTTPKALTPAGISAGGAWNWQNPLPNGNTLFAINCPSTGTCFAAGEDSPILMTTDGGTTWNHQQAVFGVFGLSCASTTICAGVGSGGLALSTSNGGATWQTQILGGGAINFLLGISCPSTSVCYASGSAGHLLKSVDGGVTWSAQTSGTTANLFHISCPNTTTCWTVGDGGLILQTTDGTTWHSQPSSVTTPLIGISCASTTVCTAFGQGGVVAMTPNGGAVWSSIGTSGSPDFTDGTCPSTTFCVASASDGDVYAGSNSNLGAASVAEPGFMWSVSCPSTTECFASGDHGIIAKTTVAGTGWTVQSPPATTDDLTGVSCPTTTTCFATGTTNDQLTGHIYETTNGGSSWAPVFTVAGTTLNPGCTGVGCNLRTGRITCPSALECLGVATASEGFVFRTTDGGTTWSTVQPEAGSTITGISCPSTSVCVLTLAAGLTQMSSDGGVTWGLQTTVSGAGVPGGLTGISCPSTTLCFATDGAAPDRIYVSTTGGSSWTLSFDLATDPQAGTGGAFTGIDCPSTTSCDAIGLNGQAVTSNDGGANWRTDNTPNRQTGLADVSCPTNGTCFAAGTDAQILVTTDLGSDWQNQLGEVSLSGLPNFAAISCPSTTACFAVGTAGAIVATTTGGGAWSRMNPIGSTEFVSSISCPNSSDCYAAAGSSGFNNGAILVSHNGGGTWTQTAPNGGDEVNSMSCPTANTCFAVGWPGTIYHSIDSGTTWTPESNAMSAADRSFTAISCRSTTSCTLVGAEGQILATTDGVNWVAQASPTTQPLLGLSCLAACVAVGVGGEAIYESAGTWHGGTTGGITQALTAVSCVSASSCYAVGDAGTLLTTNNGGASWTPQTSGVTENLDGVDCTGFGVCVAVGASGTAIYTLDGKTWAPAQVPTLNGLASVALLNSGQAWFGGSGGTILENSSLFTAPAPTVTGVLPAAGPLFGESVVTINGTGFTGGVSSVSFGGTAAPSFNVVNDTTLTATTPAHAVGAVDVTVTTLGGTSATSTADQFTYEQPYVYTSVAPQRLLDTRSSHNTLGPDGHIDLAIGGVTVPAGTRAVVLNVTAVDESTAGFFTVFPTGGVVPVASNLNWVAGETVPNLVTVGLGTGGDVTIFNGLGTADTVVDLQGYYAPTTGSSLGEYVPVVPARITDTRAGSGQTNAGLTLGPGATLDVQVTNAGGIPATGVTAVALNVTATDTTSAGFFTVFPTGGTTPLASNLNWTAGKTVPNRVIVKVGTGGKISVFNGLGRADLIVDVNGYFTDATGTGATFVPVSPTRILDTRNGTGGFNSPVGPGGTITVPVAGAGGVPGMSASTPPQAVVLNVTVTGPTQAGYLIIYPDGASRPLASDLNFAAGQTVPNLVIVKLSAGGKIDIFNGLGSTHVIVDVVGWYG